MFTVLIIMLTPGVIPGDNQISWTNHPMISSALAISLQLSPGTTTTQTTWGLTVGRPVHPWQRMRCADAAIVVDHGQ